MQLITDSAMAFAVQMKRRELELVGHKPTTADSRRAIAQAQFDADRGECKQCPHRGDGRKPDDQGDYGMPPGANQHTM